MVHDVTFLVYDDRQCVTGVALLAFDDADGKTVLLVQVVDGWELWTAETLAGQGRYWQDRDKRLRAMEELLHDWSLSTLSRPQVQYVDSAAPIAHPTPEQMEALIATRKCAFDDARHGARMQQWLDAHNVLAPWTVVFNDRPVAVTDDDFEALRNHVASQIRACELCVGQPMCQHRHHMCAAHFASYVVRHVSMLRTSPQLKTLPVCVTCGAPLCIDTLFNVAANNTLDKAMSDQLFDAVVDLAGIVRS